MKSPREKNKLSKEEKAKAVQTILTKKETRSEGVYVLKEEKVWKTSQLQLNTSITKKSTSVWDMISRY